MATYGRGQMLGSGINPESFKQDYSGFARAAETQAQGMADLGASIGGVIKDFGEQKKEQKKVDAYNKASSKAIEAAITLGKSYEVSGVEETLSPFLKAYNDPNLSPIEKAALLDEGKAMIPNVFGRFDASQADAIQRAQINASNAPKPVPLDFKPVDIAMVVNGVKGTKRVLEDANTGRIRTSDGKEYRNIEDAKAGINPINQGYNDTQIGIDNALSMPSSSGEYDPTAASVLLGGDYPDGVVSIGSPAPLGAATTTEVPQVDGPPITNVPKTSLNKESIPKFPNDFIPDDVKETYEQNVEAGGLFGQRNTKTGEFKAYPGQTGGRSIKFNPETGQLEIIEGSQPGGKAENAEAERKKQQSSFVDEFTKTAAETIKLLPSLPDNPVGAKFGAVLGEMLPGTEQGRVVSRLNTIKANLALDKINQMRAASPTGGAAGTMTVQEWPLFMQEFGSLDAAENKQDLEARLKNASVKLFNRVNGTPEERQSALDKGIITKEQNEIVQKQYDGMLSTLGVSVPKAPTSSGFQLLPDEQQLIDEFKTK